MPHRRVAVQHQRLAHDAGEGPRYPSAQGAAPGSSTARLPPCRTVRTWCPAMTRDRSSTCNARPCVTRVVEWNLETGGSRSFGESRHYAPAARSPNGRRLALDWARRGATVYWDLWDLDAHQLVERVPMRAQGRRHCANHEGQNPGARRSRQDYLSIYRSDSTDLTSAIRTT